MRKIITSTLLALLISLSGVPLLTAQGLSIDNEHNIGTLLKQAGKNIDLEQEDAVILFQRFEKQWTADGRLIESTHRATLIRTEYGLDHFADLRIPWDGARQKLTVGALRTWRLSDEQWIEAGPTAVVETLPYAVDRAPDYCHLRETMLLHDGVELPCVLETAWTIEDSEPYRPGAAGTQSLMGPEPALVSQFVLVRPAEEEEAFSPARTFIYLGGAPQPTRHTDAGTGLETMIFEMRDLAAAPHPNTIESIRLQPRILWSTWIEWQDLATALRIRINEAAILDEELREAFNEKLQDARSLSEKARLVAEFIDQTTRLVHVDEGWWPEPRLASRTWATGYGHRVDRAVLAAALYTEAGFITRPIFIGSGLAEEDSDVVRIDWSQGVSIHVLEDDFDLGLEGWFDPASATFRAGDPSLQGRTVWIPSHSSTTTHSRKIPPGKLSDRLAVRVDLAFDAEKQTWAGTGVLDAEGTVSPFNQMSGLGTEALNYLNGMVSTVLNGAKVTSCNPERFEVSGVTTGFALEVPAGERDARGRLRAELMPLPSEIHVNLQQEKRESDVHLPAPVEIQLELHLEPGDLEIVHLPASTRLENEAGLWQVEVREQEDELVLVRTLKLSENHYSAAQWPDLRALLLAEQNRAGQLLLFK